MVDYETVEVEEEVTTEAEEPEGEYIADSEGEYDDTSYIESSGGQLLLMFRKDRNMILLILNLVILDLQLMVTVME